jgi:hypothetical protein
MLRRGFINDMSKKREKDDRRENNNNSSEQSSDVDVQRSIGEYRVGRQQRNQAGETSRQTERLSGEQVQRLDEQMAQLHIRQPEQMENYQVEENSRGLERLTSAKLQNLLEYVRELPDAQSKIAFIKNLPKGNREQLIYYEIKEVTRLYMHEEQAEKFIKAIEDVEYFAMKNEKMTFNDKEKHNASIEKIRNIHRSHMEQIFSHILSSRSIEMIDEEGANSGDMVGEMNSLHRKGLAMLKDVDERMNELYR